MGGIGKAIGGVFSGLLGGIFGGEGNGGPQIVAPVAAAPTPAAPSVMPVPDDKAVKLAAQKRLATQNARRTTRQSSILSEDTGADTLGG